MSNAHPQLLPPYAGYRPTASTPVAPPLAPHPPAAPPLAPHPPVAPPLAPHPPADGQQGGYPRVSGTTLNRVQPTRSGTLSSLAYDQDRERQLHNYTKVLYHYEHELRMSIECSFQRELANLCAAREEVKRLEVKNDQLVQEIANLYAAREEVKRLEVKNDQLVQEIRSVQARSNAIEQQDQEYRDKVNEFRAENLQHLKHARQYEKHINDLQQQIQQLLAHSESLMKSEEEIKAEVRSSNILWLRRCKMLTLRM